MTIQLFSTSLPVVKTGGRGTIKQKSVTKRKVGGGSAVKDGGQEVEEGHSETALLTLG